MKTVNMNFRIDEDTRDLYNSICKKQFQNSSELLRNFMLEHIKEYFVETVQSVTLPASKAFCDEEWAKSHDIPLNIDIEVVFTEGRIEYNRSDNSSNEPILVGSDKWEDIFENYPELLEYALDI